MKRGDPAEGIRHQEQAAKEFDRLAADLDKSLDLARDPREAAPLARLQEGMHSRSRRKRRRNIEVAACRRAHAARAAEQKAIQNAVEDLSVPEQDMLAKKHRDEAVQQTKEAAEALKKQHPRPGGRAHGPGEASSGTARRSLAEPGATPAPGPGRSRQVEAAAGRHRSPGRAGRRADGKERTGSGESAASSWPTPPESRPTSPRSWARSMRPTRKLARRRRKTR